MSPAMTDVMAWLALVTVGFLPNEVWRWLGVYFARGLDEGSEIVVWVRGVATATLAAVIAKLTIWAPGALESIPLSVRLAAMGAGLVAFLLIRRSVLAGVVVGEVVLVAGALALMR